MRTVKARAKPEPLSQHQIKAGEYLRLDLAVAHEALPMVRSITRKAAEELKPLQWRLNNRVPADPRNVQLRQAYEGVVCAWTGKIERLGFKVFGLWQVGFDGGLGWYGWQHPERSIRYFLEYDAPFSGRCLIREHERNQDMFRTLQK